MQSLRTLRPASRRLLTRTQSRLASDHAAPGKDESFGVRPPIFTIPTKPTDTPPQKGFYISLATIPALLAVYKLTAPDASSSQQPYLTRLIGGLDRWHHDLAQREDLHTRTIEQAGRDRNLFLNSEDVRGVPIRYPEWVFISWPTRTWTDISTDNSIRFRRGMSLPAREGGTTKRRWSSSRRRSTSTMRARCRR